MAASWTHVNKWKRQKLSKLVFERDRYQCQIQLPGTWRTVRGALRYCTGKAEHVHHINGEYGGWENLDNMQAACAACNQRLGNPLHSGLDPVGRANTNW